MTVMTTVFDLVATVAALLLLTAATAWVVREVQRDGIGLRPAPRGHEDWSALGLPSRPYGT